MSLPFIAARAHETAATGYAPAHPPERTQVAQRHRRLWAAGAALMLMAAVAAGAWMQSGNSTALAGNAARVGDVAEASAPAEAALAAALPFTYEPPSAGRLDAGVAAAAEPGATPPDQGIAAVALPIKAAVRASDTPRGLCGTRSGYALYQCMQAQCQKRKWAQHDQCQSMRRNRTLG